MVPFRDLEWAFFEVELLFKDDVLDFSDNWLLFLDFERLWLVLLSKVFLLAFFFEPSALVWELAFFGVLLVALLWATAVIADISSSASSDSILYSFETRLLSNFFNMARSCWFSSIFCQLILYSFSSLNFKSIICSFAVILKFINSVNFWAGAASSLSALFIIFRISCKSSLSSFLFCSFNSSALLRFSCSSWISFSLKTSSYFRFVSKIDWEALDSAWTSGLEDLADFGRAAEDGWDWGEHSTDVEFFEALRRLSVPPFLACLYFWRSWWAFYCNLDEEAEAILWFWPSSAWQGGEPYCSLLVVGPPPVLGICSTDCCWSSSVTSLLLFTLILIYRLSVYGFMKSSTTPPAPIAAPFIASGLRCYSGVASK